MVRARVARPLYGYVWYWLLLTLAIVVSAIAVILLAPRLQSDKSELEHAGSLGPATMGNVVTPGFAIAQAAEGESSRTLADIAAAATRSVITVTSSRVVSRPDNPFLNDPLFRHFFGPGREVPRERRERGLGSGVLISKDGVILTNNHVVSGASEIRVILPDLREVEATVRGTDPESDLAVLKIEDVGDLIPIDVGDSNALRLGDVVIAIGNPFGLGQTVTMGIVSAMGRSSVGIIDYEDFIQTDAAINPGNSGGALVAMDGRLVGINTAIASRSGGYQGVGFAIPSSMFQPISRALLEHGKVTRGFLGVALQEVNAELQEALSLTSSDGVLIADVVANGPGANAGLKRGDVIVELDGRRVESVASFRNRIANTAPETRVQLTIIRDGRRQPVEVALGAAPRGEQPAAPAVEQSSQNYGMQLVPLSPALASRLGLPENIQGGAVVTEVAAGSPAAEAGLESGDVILQVDNRDVGSPGDVLRRLEAKKGAIALLVWRKGDTFYSVLKPPAPR
jgi:serine protease Do